MIKNTLLATMAAVGLTGCLVSTGTIYHIDDPYQFLSRAASRGAIPVMILGEPYPGRQVAVEAAVLDALDQNFRSFNKPFRVVPPGAGLSNGIVVLLSAADVKSRPLAAAVCANPARPGLVVSQGANLDVGVVYCVDGPASEAWAWLAKPAAPETGEFQDAISRAIYEGLPREIEPSRRLGGMLTPQ